MMFSLSKTTPRSQCFLAPNWLVLAGKGRYPYTNAATKLWNAICAQFVGRLWRGHKAYPTVAYAYLVNSRPRMQIVEGTADLTYAPLTVLRAWKSEMDAQLALMTKLADHKWKNFERSAPAGSTTRELLCLSSDRTRLSMDSLAGPLVNGEYEVGLDQGGQSDYDHLPMLGTYSNNFYYPHVQRAATEVALQVRGAVAFELERVVRHK